MADLAIKRNDTVKLNVVVTRTSQGITSIVNLTGAQLRFTVKSAYADADSAALIRKGSPGTGFSGIVITGAAQGTATITLDTTDTDIGSGTSYYRYDLQVKEADGTVSTIQSGRFVVQPDVTGAA